MQVLCCRLLKLRAPPGGWTFLLIFLATLDVLHKLQVVQHSALNGGLLPCLFELQNNSADVSVSWRESHYFDTSEGLCQPLSLAKKKVQKTIANNAQANYMTDFHNSSKKSWSQYKHNSKHLYYNNVSMLYSLSLCFTEKYIHSMFLGGALATALNSLMICFMNAILKFLNNMFHECHSHLTSSFENWSPTFISRSLTL